MFFQKYFSASLFCLLSLICLLTASRALAVTVNAPAAAGTGQAINATSSASFVAGLAGPNCTLQIDFGDGGGWRNTAPVCSTLNCSRSLQHIYTSAGIYPIRTRGTGFCPFTGSATDLSRINITGTPAAGTPAAGKTNAVVILPDGMVGMDYEYELGGRNNRYRQIGGRMDSGLKIIRNKIEGIPKRKGQYRFKISAMDQRGAITDTLYSLKITKALLRVKVSPEKVTTERNRSGSFHLTYTFSASEEINDELDSNTGFFLAGSRRLGSVHKHISTKIIRGKGKLVEQVTIPLEVIKNAQRQGINEIRYKRTFKAGYMDKVATSSMAVTVGTGFTFTKIRIYFADDKTSKKFVKRNERNVGARVELRYEGAGLLKGYWQADDRILARVIKNLPFSNGRTITLTLPKVPPLPTHSIGSHRLRFVITNPSMRIPFPQDIYIVTGEALETVHPIYLIGPKEDIEVTPKDLNFSWKSRSGVVMYHLELLTGKGEKQAVIFSAFSKKTAYTLPSRVAHTKLQSGTSYSWRVTGLDRNNNPVARSKVEHFFLGDKPLAYLPNRLLMLVDTAKVPQIENLVDTLRNQYPLTLVSQKTLPGLNRELVIFATTGDVEKLVGIIGFARPDVQMQPDYFYSTLGEITEQANQEILFSFLGMQLTGTGRGIRVAVIDTGVDLNHDDLAANIVAHANLVDNSPYRGEIHGTAVASIIAARVDGNETAGIAPHSGVIALRACEQLSADKAKGRCYSSSIVQAIDRAVQEKAMIINMSLGTDAPDHLVAAAIGAAADGGITLLAPAGNDSSMTKLSFPASLPEVVSVAGVLDHGRNIPNSLVARQADCILPAGYIQVALPGNRISFMHGTSMATAEAAGLFADIRVDRQKIVSCRKTKRLLPCLANM